MEYAAMSTQEQGQVPSKSDGIFTKLKEQFVNVTVEHFMTVAISVLVSGILAALSYLFVHWFVQGGIIGIMGGVTKTQLSKAFEPPSLVSSCPTSPMNGVELGKVDDVFCVLTENSTFSVNAGTVGWRTCKIETKDPNDSRTPLYLKAEIWAPTAEQPGKQLTAEQMCSKAPGVQIVCKARCIRINE
jgi:hypothetical protein